MLATFTESEIQNVLPQLSDEQKTHLLRSMRKIAIEAQRRRTELQLRRMVAESVFVRTGMSPVALQRAFEMAIENKNEIWKNYRDASYFEVLRCEENEIERKKLAQSLKASRKKLSEIKKEIKSRFCLSSMHIQSHGMPQVPPPQMTRSEWGSRRDVFSGVYIAFKNDKVQYVGESINIPQRMRSHQEVKNDWLVSVIETIPSERFFAECYYIWLLRPPKNGQGIKTSRACNV
jgi:hypothetical protein